MRTPVLDLYQEYTESINMKKAAICQRVYVVFFVYVLFLALKAIFESAEMMIILSYVLTLTLIFLCHRLGAYLIKAKRYLLHDFLLAFSVSFLLITIWVLFEPFFQRSTDSLEDDNLRDSKYWLGVRQAMVVMIPVLVLRSWKFKIGIYIALYIVMLLLLNDFQNMGSLFTVINLIAIGYYMASIWKVVDNQ